MPNPEFVTSARCLLLATAALVPTVLLAQSTAATPPGVLWQTRSQMSMEGMPFTPPANSVKVCARADAVEPPGSADEERGCVNSDFVTEGLKVTWTSVCSGPPAMTGQGEITYADETFASYTGALHYTTAEGAITITLSGERDGTCNNPR